MRCFYKQDFKYAGCVCVCQSSLGMCSGWWGLGTVELECILWYSSLNPTTPPPPASLPPIWQRAAVVIMEVEQQALSLTNPRPRSDTCHTPTPTPAHTPLAHTRSHEAAEDLSCMHTHAHTTRLTGTESNCAFSCFYMKATPLEQVAYNVHCDTHTHTHLKAPVKQQLITFTCVTFASFGFNVNKKPQKSLFLKLCTVC